MPRPAVSGIAAALGEFGDNAMHLVLTPSYGRDYTSKKAVLEDWHGGKDFTIAGPLWATSGSTQINKQDADREGTVVNIRYSRNMKVIVVKPGKAAS